MSDEAHRPRAAGRFAAGARISGYCLEELIGRGGMAEVFRARDERLGRLVVLKIIAPGTGRGAGVPAAVHQGSADAGCCS